MCFTSTGARDEFYMLMYTNPSYIRLLIFKIDLNDQNLNLIIILIYSYSAMRILLLRLIIIINTTMHCI